MTQIDRVIEEVRTVPEPLLLPILEYIRSLKENDHAARRDITLASEEALAKDWLRPEEDAAWQDL